MLLPWPECLGGMKVGGDRRNDVKILAIAVSGGR